MSESQKALLKVLTYLLHDEHREWEVRGRPEDHIYTHVLAASELLPNGVLDLAQSLRKSAESDLRRLWAKSRTPFGNNSLAASTCV